MKKRLICQMSPLNRPVSKRTSRRKESMSGKKGFHKIDTQPHESVVSLSDCDVSGLSSSKSTGMKTSGFSADQVLSQKNQGPVKNQNHDDNPQGRDEIYLKPAEIKRRKSSPLKAVSATAKSPGISKRRYSAPLLSPSKRFLHGSVNGLDGIVHSHTQEVMKSRKGKKEKSENVDKQPLDPGVPFTSHCDVSLSPNWSSSKPQESEETYLKPSVMKRKKSPSLKTISVASRSAKILKQRYSAPFLSPGKRLLSRCMHGLDGIGRPRTVSMTAVDMKKQEEAIGSRIRTKRKNRKVDVGTQPYETEVSFTKSHATSEVSSVSSPRLRADEFLVDSSKPKVQDDHPQEIDEIHLKPASVKGKKSSCKTVLPRSSRIPKQRYTSSFLYSPGKRDISRCMHGLDEIHQETVSMTTNDMNEQKEITDSQITKKKEHGKLSVDTHSPPPDLIASWLSSSRSPGMKTKDFLDDLSETQENDDNLQGIHEIHLKPSGMKKKKSSFSKTVSLGPRSHKIWKRRNSMPLLSPGKRLLSKSMHGRRHTVSMTIVDMKKLQEFIDSSQMRKRKRNGKVNVDSQPDRKSTILSAGDHDVSGSSSSPEVEVDVLWAGSSKVPKQDKHPQGINEIHLKQANIKRKKSASFITVASKSPRILKRRYSAPILSPGKRSLSRSMHGLQGIHRRTVSMTTVEMKKLQEVVKNHLRNEEKKNGKFDDTTQLEGNADTSLTVSNSKVSGSSRSLEVEADVFLTESSRTQEKDDQLEGFDEIHPQQAGIKRKTSSLHKILASRSQTIPKRRYSSSFLSPRKRLLSGSKHGLDGIHRCTVSMTTVDMKNLDELIKDQSSKKKKNEKVDDTTQVDGPADTSVTVSSHEVSGSSTSSGVEADVFLTSLVLNKTQESSQCLETAQDLHRSNDNRDTPKITKTKESPSCKKISAKSRSPKVQKHRKTVPFVSPGKRLLSRSMRGMDELHRCHNLSMTKVKRKKLQEAIDLSQLKKKSEKLGPNPVGSLKSPNQKTEEIVNTAVDKVMECIPLSCLKRQEQSAHEPELSLQDKAVAHAQKECEETITHATNLEVEVKSAKTPDLDFKELGEMYNRRFNPSQKCSQADLDFEKLYKKQFDQSQKCTQAEVNMDTVTRILSFQDEQKDSNKESPPIIQRCAFAGDIIDPESEVSDSTIDEANETLLEKEVRNFFGSKKGHYPRNIREGNLAFDTAPGCVQEQRENEVTESEPIISTGQMNKSQPIPEDNIIIIDEDTHYRTPESLMDIEYLKELAEEIHKSIPDSPRETGDLQQDAKNTHRSITGSDKETKDLQKETENTYHIQDSPRSTGRLHRLAENSNHSTMGSHKEIEELQKELERKHHIIQDSPRRSNGDLKKLAEDTNHSTTGSHKETEDLQRELENTHHILQDSPRSTGGLQKCAENTHGDSEDNLRNLGDLQKLAKNSHHIIQDSPRRGTGELQKLAENTQHSITGSDKGTEDLQKETENTYRIIQDSPRSPRDLQKLAENTNHSTTGSHKETEDLQKELEKTHHIIQDSPRSTGRLQKCAENTCGDTEDSPRDIEDLQKVSKNTDYCIADNPRENEDMQIFSKNGHHIIPESPRDVEYMKKVPDNTYCGTTDSPRDSEVLQKLTGNNPVPCSQGNKDRKTVFERNQNQQTVPMEENIEQALLQRVGSLENQDHVMAGMVNDFGESMLVDTEGDRPWNDSCPPFQHSTPADPTNHPESSRISTNELFSVWAEIEQEEKMFVLYCHDFTAPCILKDLEKCPDIIDRKSLSMRYLNDGCSVEVKGMVLKKEDPVRSETCSKKNKKDAAKKEKEGKQEKVVTMTREAEKKNVHPSVDAVTKKKKSNTKRGQKMKAEVKKVVRRKTKQEIKSAEIIERKVEAITDAKKELIQGATNEINKKNGKKIKKTNIKEPKQETEARTKKESKREETKKTKKGIEKGPKGEIQKDKLKVKMKTKTTTQKSVKEKKKDEMKKLTEEEVREMKKDTTKETKKKTKKKTQEKTQNKIKKEAKKETKIEAKFSRDPTSGKWKVINIPVEESTTKKARKARKKSPLKTQYKVIKKTRLETKMKKCEVTVSQDPTSRKLRIISGPIKGPARKKNESRWEHELREQLETRWSKINVQPSLESDCCMMRCLKGTAWTVLKQQEKGHIVQDREQGFEDDDSDLETFVDLVSFPDVFMTAQTDRPSFHKVPPSEIQILDGF